MRTREYSTYELTLLNREMVIQDAYHDNAAPLINYIVKMKVQFEIPRFIIKEDGTLESDPQMPPEVQKLVNKAHAALKELLRDTERKIKEVWEPMTKTL